MVSLSAFSGSSSVSTASSGTPSSKISLLCLVLSGVGQPADLHDANLIVEVKDDIMKMDECGVRLDFHCTPPVE